MQENNHDNGAEDFLKNLPVHSEEVGFKPDEMVACGACARLNAPNRLKCMYCGAALEISSEQAGKIKPVLRKLENWEQGFNLIYLPNDEQISPDGVQQIAKLIGREKEFAQKVLEARKPVPVARCETQREAVILKNHLDESGLSNIIVADEALDAENAPKRLRNLEFRDGYLLMTIFNTNEVEAVSLEDLRIIVPGAIFQKAVESTEARKKGESKILDATETASDESLLDLYSENNYNGYRILTKGFDFSSLGAEKGILARENLKRLVAKLAQSAPHARVVDDYLALRGVLGEIWEVEQRKDSQGLTRQRFGKFDLSNVSTSNNLQQFTKYSRLQWHLL